NVRRPVADTIRPPRRFPLHRPRGRIYTDQTACPTRRRTIMSRRTRPSLLLACFLIVCATAVADDTPLAKQRQTADAIAKSLHLSSIVTHETKNLIVLGTFPDAKLKVLGATLEKQYATGVKALQFADDDPPWSGKL